MIQKRTMIFVSGPRLHLEVVVDRRHQEDPPAPVLEADDLEDHGQRLDHEDAADEEQQQLGLRHHCERAERAADRHRAGVAHEHVGREGVEPEEADRGARPARRPGSPCRGRRCVRLDRLLPEADEGEDVDGGEGDQGDDPGAGREPVDAVGEVHAVRGARDDQEHEHVPDPPEVDRPRAPGRRSPSTGPRGRRPTRGRT